ncbi:MAG: zinc-dependent dehydrogenase [Candidatus Omnitrophica bacterium]|nr:zinc-dependent dehydrogenase [Candidatus Omnitrophota bacterium]
MRVATYYNNNDIRIDEVPKPKIGPGELLLRIEASGICGTDVIEWYRRDKVPLVLGHEIAGEVVEVGKGLTRYKKGQRLSASHHVPCGKCKLCLSGHETTCDMLRKTKFYPGGFAEFVRLPKINIELGGVYPLGPSVTFEQGTFTEPLACVLRGQRLARMQEGKSLLVLGAGISGILHIMLAKYKGAGFIAATDLVDYRLDFAKRLGADITLNAAEQDIPGRFKGLNKGEGADIVIVATGAKAAHLQALESVKRGGTVLFFAATAEGETIPLSINDVFWRNEVTLTSSYAATPKEHMAALRLIASGKIAVEELITHRFSLDDIQEGFRLVAQARDSMKVIIKPQGLRKD